MSINKVLIADDDHLVRSFLKNALERQNFEIVLADNGKTAFEILKKEPFDLLITDMKMPEKNGLELLKAAKKLDPSLMVIIMSAHSTIENVVSAMKAGAFNYLIKPFSLEALETLLAKANEQRQLIKENLFLRSENQSDCKLIRHSPFLMKKLSEMKKIAQSDASVLISGESGTGKEVVASFMHAFSQRKTRPFIKVNCAAIPETLIEAEFFGHEKGAFTGADQQRIGRFELADSGTLLLDEISEIPLTLQAKLLRVLQEREVERIGSSKPMKINVRILATSNRNMEEAVQKKMFREDLFFRLNVVPFHIPPLRERKEDILPLAYYFLNSFSQKYKKNIKKLTSDAKRSLLAYSWPGNVRELSNIIERAVVLDMAQNISAEDLNLEKKPVPTANHSIKNKTALIEKNNPDNTNEPSQTLAELEKKVILKTLQEQNNSRCKTAKILGISERTLRYKLKAYGNPK